MKKLPYILYIVLILAIIGLVLYDFLPDHFVGKETIMRCAVLIIAAIVGMLRFSGKGRKSVANKKSVYSKAYAEYIGRAFSSDPKTEKLFYKAVDYFNQDNPEKCIDTLERIRSECRNSEDIYAVTVFKALSFDEMRLDEEAINHYYSALQMKQNSTLASNLAVCYDRIGEEEKAIYYYQQAITLNPKNAYPHNNLAQKYVRLGEYEQAIKHAKDALSINPKVPQALSAMTISSYMLGNKEDYEKYYRQAVSNGYDGKKLKAYIASLDASID